MTTSGKPMSISIKPVRDLKALENIAAYARAAHAPDDAEVQLYSGFLGMNSKVKILWGSKDG